MELPKSLAWLYKRGRHSSAALSELSTSSSPAIHEAKPGTQKQQEEGAHCVYVMQCVGGTCKSQCRSKFRKQKQPTCVSTVINGPHKGSVWSSWVGPSRLCHLPASSIGTCGAVTQGGCTRWPWNRTSPGLHPAAGAGLDSLSFLPLRLASPGFWSQAESKQDPLPARHSPCRQEMEAWILLGLHWSLKPQTCGPACSQFLLPTTFVGKRSQSFGGLFFSRKC